MEFRSMRRRGQEMTGEECKAILARVSHITLAVIGDGGYPYSVPMSFVLWKDCLYLHSARKGHKIDAITACDKVCLSVVARDDVVSEEYATLYESVIVFGRAEIVQNEEERWEALMALGRKYAPDADDRTEIEVRRDGPAAAVIRVSIEHMSGKRARGLL